MTASATESPIVFSSSEEEFYGMARDCGSAFDLHSVVDVDLCPKAKNKKFEANKFAG